MEVQSYRTLALSLCLAGGLMALGVGAQAQSKPEAAATPAFKARLEPLGGKLSNIEQRVDTLTAKVNKTRVFTQADMSNAELDKAMQAYADAMKAAHDEALKDAEKAAKSRGKEGNVANLKAFEDLAKAHEARLKAIEAKTKKIEEQMKVGAIRLDKPLLQKATPAQREEFRKFLMPEGVRQMEKSYPELFKPGPQSRLDSLRLAELVGPAGESCRTLAGGLVDRLISPAEAAIAAPCVAPCAAKNWGACATCVVGAGPQVVQAFNDFQKCWGGSGKPWWIASWLWKTGCVAVFVAKLA